MGVPELVVAGASCSRIAHATVLAIRFSASLENARVEIKDSGEGFRSFTGLGLSGNVVGPWKTVVSLSWGYALASDIPDLEGQQEFYLLVLKLF